MRLRVAFLGLAVIIVGVGIALLLTQYLIKTPPVVTASTTSNSVEGLPVVNVTLTTVAAAGSGPHPNWVAYLNDNGDPSTYINAPANSVIHMTINQQDTPTGLRNEYFGLVRGTIDGSMKVNGKTMQAIDPTTAAHTFTIPDLGVSVPLLGVAADQKGNPPQNVVEFDFRVPGPGLYRWQCFVPCGAGTLYGNGGPMQTLGYMAGELVVS
jgi:hypothetical protein